MTTTSVYTVFETHLRTITNTMADSLIVNGTEMNVDSLKLLAPRANKGGKGKTARIMAPSGNSLNLSAPLMLTWGVNEYETETGQKKYSIPLQFPQDQYANENQRKFLQNIKDLEERVIQEACKNSMEWFNKPSMTPEAVKEYIWTPILKHPKDKETGQPDMTRPPTMKIKIRYWDDKFNLELYDVNRQPLFKPETQETNEQTPIDIITKGSHVACVIQCGGIWFAGGKFGVTFNLVQAIVRQPVKIQGACHVPLNSVDCAMIDEENTREEKKQQEAAEEDDGAQIVEDEEDDDEEEQPAPEEPEPTPEPEPEPEPEPKKRGKPRKIAKRKKTT